MEHTAKHFALQLGALITVYVTLTSLIVLAFSIINLLIPDAAASMWETEQASSSARFAIATLIIFFPVYLWLTRTVNQLRRNGEGVYLTLTKWLIYLSLVVGGLVLLGNAVATVYTFLNGELTLRFVCKAVVLFVVVGSACAYYVLDARNYWQQHERASVWWGIIATIVVVVTVGFGFTRIDTPLSVREARIDDRQIEDLQQIQWKVTEYLGLNGALPETLEEAFGDMPIPQAPEGRPAYEYQITGISFELCATFAEESKQPSVTYPYYDDKSLVRNPDSWYHQAGRYCFNRNVNIEAVSALEREQSPEEIRATLRGLGEEM